MTRVLAVPKRKALIVAGASDNAQLVSVTDRAQIITYKQHRLIAMPHTLWNARMLQLMQVPAPSPIEYEYDWPGRYQPKRHQIDTAGFITLHNRSFVLNSIGTGKTLSLLWAVDYMMKIGDVQRAIIVAPLSTLERVWADEIFSHLQHRRFAVLHGSATKRRKLLQEDVDFYIINHDGMEIVQPQLMQRDDINFIGLDESSVYKNSQTRMYKVMKAYTDARNGKLRLTLMTATPTPNAPTDAWPQCRLVSPTRVPRYFKQFKEDTMRQITTFKWVPKADAVDKVIYAMQPAIRFTREQCLDLPPTIYQTQTAELTPKQQRLYTEMAKKLYIELEEGGEVNAMNEAIKMGKLVQIACGAVYDNEGNTVELDPGPRLRLLTDLIEQAGEKVIVFAPLLGVLDLISREVGKRWSSAHIDGGVSKNDRDRIFTAFQTQKDPHVLVAHPRTMSHGLTLTEATTIIWYAPYPSSETYEQANGRIARQGQTKTTNVIHIAATPLERMMYQRLEAKQRLQGILLEAVKNLTMTKEK